MPNSALERNQLVFRWIMAHLHPILVFLLIVVLSPFNVISNGLGKSEGGGVSMTQGETGPLKAVRSSEEEEMQDVCRCLSAETYNQACPKLLNYGPIIRNGNCFGNLITRTKRGFLKSDGKFSSPPAFIESTRCRGTKTIILSSSGAERKLTLTTQASVFICPGSIESSLQELDISSVSKIIIAPGAFKSRDSDISIRFSNVYEKIVIPEEAFSVQIVIPGSPTQISDNEFDGILKPPPLVSLDVNTASEIEFRSRSVVAPIVEVKLSRINNVQFGPEAIIPYAHPEASTLEVGHCKSVIMETRTINAGKFEAKYIKKLLMRERAVEVVSDDGAGAKVEHVVSMTIMDEALSVGSGADIIFNNITLTSAGIRSIQGSGPGNLRRATFTHVKGKQLASVAMCIRTETAVVFSLEFAGKSSNDTAACIQGQEIHWDSGGVAVVCKKLDVTSYICDDPRCSFCSPNSEDLFSVDTPFTTVGLIPQDNDTSAPNETVTVLPLASSSPFDHKQAVSSSLEDQNTPSSQGIFMVTLLPNLVNASSVLLSKDSNQDTEDDSDSAFFQILKQTPIYIIIIFLCAVLILIIIVVYLVYRCCTHNKHDKYNLPQENRLSTFRNPRTIMTPENLTDQSDPPKCDETQGSEVYTTFDSYRQPVAAYIVSSDNDIHEDSSNDHVPYQEDLPAGHYQLETGELERDYNAPDYHNPVLNNEDIPTRVQRSSSDNCHYLCPKDELLLNSCNPYDASLPNQEKHLPPADGYVRLSDEQPVAEDLSLSDSGSSCPENYYPPHPDYQHSSAEQQMYPNPDNCDSLPANKPLDNNHALATGEVLILDKHMSTREAEQPNLNRLSLFENEQSDDELII